MNKEFQMILFVMITGTILTTMLLAVDATTEPIIRKNGQIKMWNSILSVSTIPYSSDSLEDVFKNNVETIIADQRTVYKTREGIIAFEFNGSGLWGPIRGIIALQPDLKTLKGISIIHQEETPGLGGRIGEKEFLDQFKNLQIHPGISITSNRKATAAYEVDGISGATLSCNAFEQILNKSIQSHFSGRQEL